jgi:hypothetical protein
MNGISTSKPTTKACIDLGTRNLIDVKFLNDETLVLVCEKGEGVTADSQSYTVLARPWFSNVSS